MLTKHMQRLALRHAQLFPMQQSAVIKKSVTILFWIYIRQALVHQFPEPEIIESSLVLHKGGQEQIGIRQSVCHKAMSVPLAGSQQHVHKTGFQGVVDTLFRNIKSGPSIQYHAFPKVNGFGPVPVITGRLYFMKE